MSRASSGGCADAAAPVPLTHDQTLERLLARVRPLESCERVPTEEALARVLAEPVTAPIDVPGWDNSAMDGYAVRAADLGPEGARLRVAQRIPAGTAGQPLDPGTAARIFTGAPVPAGADTVVVQEICERDGDWVRIPPDAKPGANIRRAGEDLARGAEVLAAGTRLGPQHLGLAASLGLAVLPVARRPRVAILASGDELVEPGEPLAPGRIYNSNRFLLRGLLAGWGAQVLDLGQVPDSLEATVEALGRAAEGADLVLASGGVSVGEEDHVRPAVERLGRLDLWNVAIRPGKPLAFGFLGPGADRPGGGTPFLGSPGNPVSLFVTCCLFARPLVLRLQGVGGDPSGDLVPRRLKVRAAFDWPRPDRRREFHRARLRAGADGWPEASVFPSRSAAALSSLAWADGLVEIPEGRVIRPGEPVDFIPFASLLGG